MAGRSLSARARRAVVTSALALLMLGCGSGENRASSPNHHGPEHASGQTAGESSCGHLGDPEPQQLAGMTAAHNAIRCQVSRPSGEALAPLSWSSALAAEAQSYADRLAKDGCTLQHSQPEHGENLFAGSGRYTAAEVTERWLSEQQCFRHATFPDCCSCTCGHYTQLVWSDTRHLGCGMAACSDGSEVWVCNYDPAGNYTGSAPY
jgi:pathogenesis-related protein 1